MSNEIKKALTETIDAVKVQNDWLGEAQTHTAINNDRIADSVIKLAGELYTAGIVSYATPKPPEPDPVTPGMVWNEFYGMDLPFYAPVPLAYETSVDAMNFDVTINGDGTDKIAKLYINAKKNGHEGTFRVGVYGDAGRVWPGGQYSANNSYSIPLDDVDLEIVGLDATARVHVGWSTEYGSCKRLALFNIGIVGGSDSFIIRGSDPVGTVILHGCWWERGPNSPDMYTSGLHIDNYRALIVNGMKHREGLYFREHDFYPKSSLSGAPGAGTYFINNEKGHGARSYEQRRPQQFKDYDKVTPSNAWPVGPYVIANNDITDQGWNHPLEDGAGAFTVWTSPNPEDGVYIFGNKGKNLRYSGIVVEPQPVWKNYLNGNGFPLSNVHVYANDMDNPNSSRSLAKFSGIEGLNLYPNNLRGRIVFDSGWSSQMSGIVNEKPIKVHGQATAEWIANQQVQTAKGGSSSRDVDVPNGWLASNTVTL